MFLRSFGKGLYEDGYFVSLQGDRVLDKLSQISEEDNKTGYIYVLESLSSRYENCIYQKLIQSWLFND